MYSMNDPEIILACNFNKAAFKGRKGKQLFQVDEMKMLRNFDIENDACLDYYKKLIKEGKTKSYSAILALLLRQQVSGINLRGKHIRIYFIDGNHIRIDLTSPELVDYYEQLVKTIVTDYKNEREKSINYAFKQENMNLLFVRNIRDNRSFYKYKQENIICEFMCNQRANAFELDEQKVLDQTIEKFILENESDKISINEGHYKTFGASPYYPDNFIQMSTLNDLPCDYVVFSGKNREIILDGLPWEMMQGAITRIKEYNNQHDQQEKQQKEYKKEMKNCGTN